ncbi:MAG: hypothetical protein IJF45_01075 [Clostridia bacterium]|nr:hypothetical protein [Clostridia bacterium]
MKTSERVLFIIGAVLTVAALLLACFAAYFGVSALISIHFHDMEGAQSIGVAFMLVFLAIFAVAAWGAALLAAILLFIRPARAKHPRVRRWSRIFLLLLLVSSLLIGLLLILCMIG